MAEDPGSIPGSGRSPGEGNGSTPASLPGIPWIEVPGRLDRKESDITEQLTVLYVNPVRKIGSTLGFSKMEVNIVNQLIDIRWLEEQKKDCWVCTKINNCRKQLLSLGLGKQRREPWIWMRDSVKLVSGPLEKASGSSFSDVQSGRCQELCIGDTVQQVPRRVCASVWGNTGAAHTPVFKGDMPLVPTSTDSGTRNWRLQPAVYCYWDNAATHWKTRGSPPFPFRLSRAPYWQGLTEASW